MVEQQDSPRWSYRLSINQDNNRRPVVREEVARRGDEAVLQRPDVRDEQDQLLLIQTALEQIVANQNFRSPRLYFHVRYNEYRASCSIEPIAQSAGALP